MSLSKTKFNEFKKLLEKRSKEIRTELSDFAKNDNKNKDNFISKFPDFGNKDDENAREVSAYMDRLSLENTWEKELQDVESALKRIEKGTYGVCKYCGKDIGEKRLKGEI